MKTLMRLFQKNREPVVSEELDDWLAREHGLSDDDAESRSIPDLLRNLAQRCQRVAVVGSHRRGAPDPGDLDLLYIPKNRTQVIEFLESAADDERLISRSESAWSCTVQGVHVDFIESASERWGVDMVFFTGSRDFNERVLRHASRRGYEIINGRPSVQKKGGYTSYYASAFDGWSEEKILTQLGLEAFLNPRARNEKSPQLSPQVGSPS